MKLFCFANSDVNPFHKQSLIVDASNVFTAIVLLSKREFSDFGVQAQCEPVRRNDGRSKLLAVKGTSSFVVTEGSHLHLVSQLSEIESLLKLKLK